MRQKQLKHLLRRKPIRRKKIGRCEERKLIRRGSKDLANGIVRKNEEQKYSSPFLKQEISLCLVQINIEKEKLAEILAFYNNQIFQKKLQVKGLESCLKNIDIPENPDDSPIIKYDGEESLEDDFVQLFRKSEYYQKRKVIQQQKENLESSKELLGISQNEDEFIVQKEKEITKYRCIQHYNLLLARLSAYWNGVLKGKTGDASDIPPICFVEDLLQELQYEIEHLGLEEEGQENGKEKF